MSGSSSRFLGERRNRSGLLSRVAWVVGKSRILNSSIYMLRHIVTVVGCASVKCTLHSRFVVEADQARPSLLGTSQTPCIVTQAPSR